MKWSAIAIVSVAACSNQLGTVVRGVHVEGRSLVVERCHVQVTNGRIGASDCFHEYVTLPAEIELGNCPVPTVAAAAAEAPPLGPEQVDETIEVVRERVLRCAPLLPGGGTIRVHLDVGRSGVVVGTTLESGSADLTECVRDAFKRARFPRTANRSKLILPFELPP